MGVVAAAYARMLRRLLPPGSIWRFGSSLLQDVLEGAAVELERVDGRAADLLREADPLQAVELLPEYELALGLSSEGTNAERQARIAAHLVRRQRYRPKDFRNVLAPLLDVDATDVEVIEVTRANAVAAGDDRLKFRFYVYRGTDGAFDDAEAQSMLEKMKPTCTRGTVIYTKEAVAGASSAVAGKSLVG